MEVTDTETEDWKVPLCIRAVEMQALSDSTLLVVGTFVLIPTKIVKASS